MDADQAGALGLGYAGSDYINDTQLHIAGPPPKEGAAPGEVYHADVERWYGVVIVDAPVSFGPGNVVEMGDPPQENEPVPVMGWYGPLKKVRTNAEAPVRLLRG